MAKIRSEAIKNNVAYTHDNNVANPTVEELVHMVW